MQLGGERVIGVDLEREPLGGVDDLDQQREPWAEEREAPRADEIAAVAGRQLVEGLSLAVTGLDQRGGTGQPLLADALAEAASGPRPMARDGHGVQRCEREGGPAGGGEAHRRSVRGGRDAASIRGGGPPGGATAPETTNAPAVAGAFG